LQNAERPNLFINELNLYIDYLRKDIGTHLKGWSDKKEKYLLKFKNQLQDGINYYKDLLPQISGQTKEYINQMQKDLLLAEAHLEALSIGSMAV
jgi:hypothetical protein